MKPPCLPRRWTRTVLVIALLQAAVPVTPATPLPGDGPAASPVGARTIVELQSVRRSQTVALEDGAGRRGSATLTNLNPAINAWFVLTLPGSDRREAVSYHLENAAPSAQRIALDPARPGELTLTVAGLVHRCALWPGNALDQARRTALPYAPLCDARLYLRNPVRGNRSTLEATTEFLRDHVWRGEQIVGFVRREFYRDAFAERARPPRAASGASRRHRAAPRLLPCLPSPPTPRRLP